MAEPAFVWERHAMTRAHLIGCVALWCGSIGAGACTPRKEAPPAPPAAQRQEAPPPPTKQQEPPTMDTKLECTLSVAPQVAAGEPVEVLFRLTNRTERPLYVLDWHTPLEGLRSNLFTVTRDGAEVPYEGPMMKRGAPSADDYVAIAPGASVEARVDVSLAYDFKPPGRYRLTFRDELMDVATEQAELPHRLEGFRPLPVKCPSVETTRTGA